MWPLGIRILDTSEMIRMVFIVPLNPKLLRLVIAMVWISNKSGVPVVGKENAVEPSKCEILTSRI